MTEQTREEQRLALRGAIVLRKRRGDNAYEGLIEHSFCMDWSKDRVRFFWTGKAYWGDVPMGEIDGLVDAHDQAKVYRQRYPEDIILVFDAHAEDLPIIIDWDFYSKARNKFDDRNVKFVMKE